jgi:ribosomal protein L11 methyltransferase
VTIQDVADQPILEPAVGETLLWDQCIVTALFPTTVDTQEINLQFYASILSSPQIRWEQLEDKDWSQEWKKHFNP